MSSLINKAKEALSRDKGDDPRSDNYGAHQHDTMNKADPRIDSDMDHRNNPTSTYGSSDPHSGGAYTGTTATGSTNAGPHSSNLMNKVDPRVDSDRDNRNDPTSRVGGYGAQEGYGAQGMNPAPSSGHTSHTQTGYGAGPTGYGGDRSTNAGPHNSNLMNKMDPRVDSDMDNRNDPTSRVGGYGTHDNYGAQGAYGAGAGHTAPQGHGLAAQSNVPTQSGYGAGTSTNAGPHNSNLMNKMDPRIDSDMDNRNDPTSRVGGYGTQDNYGPGTSHPHTTHPSAGYGGDHSAPGYGTTSTTTHHTSSDAYGSSATPGSGNAAGTAGPHNSNLMNKLDPRVDSDLDGSKTYGGNKTNY